MQQVLNNQISNSARLIPAIKELLKNGRMTIQQIYEVPSIKALSKGEWSVREAVKVMNIREKSVRKLPHHDPKNMQIRHCYELIQQDDKPDKLVERRHVHPTVVQQVNHLFSKPKITIREHSVILEFENFSITIED